jgi:biopolymer transport protein ExbB
LAAMMNVYSVLPQLPGVDAPERTITEQLSEAWTGAGFMRYPLGLCILVGAVVIIWKFFDIMLKAGATRKILREVDELLAQQQIREALELTRESDSPAANILHAGLERRDEGTDRVMKAIENQGLIELSKLERGLVVLATLTNIAPLMGFLGTVMGMIAAFQAIEFAGEVDATTVAGGIKTALYTTAAGLAIAIPISICHNYFVSRIDHLVIDMEESAQKMIDALFVMQAGQEAGD